MEKEQRDLVIESGENGSFRVIIDGRQTLVDAVAVAPNTWSLLIDGRSYLVDIDERKRGTVILAGATEVAVEIEDAQQKRLADAVSAKSEAIGTGEVVVAPIAGRVVKLLVEAGDVVSPGQGVAVLEAMKMENEINAERGGTVETIHVLAGVSVDTLDSLVTLS